MPDTPLPAPPRADASRRVGVTDADRERIATILSNGFAEDAISLDEFEQRVAGVYRATTRAELEALVADLRAAPGVHTPATATATAIATADDVPGHDRRFAVLASLTHHSMAIMPRRLDVSAVLGNVELDLRDATFGAGESELHLRAVLGNITVTLPAGAVVEQRASSVLGSIDCQPSPARAGRSRATVVRLTGHAVLGAVEIRFAAPGSPARGVRGSAPRLDKPRRAP